MKASVLLRELMNYILEHGDREVITAQKNEEGVYTFGDVRIGIVDYDDGTIGLVGYCEKSK